MSRNIEGLCPISSNLCRVFRPSEQLDILSTSNQFTENKEVSRLDLFYFEM